MLNLARIVIVSAGLALPSLPALAQDAAARVGQSGDKLVYEAEGHRFTTALPAWIAVDEDLGLEDAEVIITGDDNSTRFEIVPRGENAETWTHMFGVRIVLEPERNLTEYRQAAAYGYALSCNGETGQFFLTDADTDEEVAPLVFICGQFVPEANRPGEGQVMVLGFRRTDEGIAVVYEEFRTPEFDGTDQADWPVAGTALVERGRDIFAQSELILIDSN